MSSSGPTAQDIQNHLYTSFLEARTYDVILRVAGAWQACYRLHRVVLIQSGFFRSLFTSGFAESTPRKRARAEEIVVCFDDHNIHRDAFEVCLARLYGSGPPLFTPSWMLPTATNPLPLTTQATHNHGTPAGHQIATPRFLLALLATSIYLSIPTLASQALSTILSTIGPTTVVPYLRFALGLPVPCFEGEESQAAIGLEGVAEMIHEGTKLDDESESVISMDTVSDTDTTSLQPDNPSHHYGSISDKIGEAASCWLARWGADFINHETRFLCQTFPPLFSSREPTLPTIVEGSKTGAIPVIWGAGGLTAKFIRATLSSDAFFVRGERERYDCARAVVELRRQDGLIAEEEVEWDLLFKHAIHLSNLPNEDLIRISKDLSPTTKRPFVPVATLQSALWDHTVLKSRIILPRARSSSMTSSPSPPAAGDTVLGLGLTDAELRSSLEDDNNTISNKPFFPVCGDSSLRYGESGQASGQSLTMDELFASASNAGKPGDDARSLEQLNEDTFFGLLPRQRLGADFGKGDIAGRWVQFPPTRFGVEFWDLGKLKEKQRLHSQTIFHAGSLYNIYVQTVKKKGQNQLGIYIHRQSSLDPIPSVSAPQGTMSFHPLRRGIDLDAQTLHHNRGPSLPDVRVHTRSSTLGSPLTLTPSSPTRANYSPALPSRSSTPVSRTPTSSSLPSSGSFPGSSPVLPPSISGGPARMPGITPDQPYRDPRPSVSAYFLVHCHSSTGNSRTMFSSAPDVFKVSQSWGWKSSSLMDDEVVDAEIDDLGKFGKREVSFRATVLIGLV